MDRRRPPAPPAESWMELQLRVLLAVMKATDAVKERKQAIRSSIHPANKQTNKAMKHKGLHGFERYRERGQYSSETWLFSASRCVHHKNQPRQVKPSAAQPSKERATTTAQSRTSTPNPHERRTGRRWRHRMTFSHKARHQRH